MREYSGFALCYDALMNARAPYELWAERIRTQLAAHGITSGIVAELGCGTGQLTRRLAAAGYDMIGIDRSEEMLSIAMEQEAEAFADIDMEADDIEANVAEGATDDIEANIAEATDATEAANDTEAATGDTKADSARRVRPRILYLCQDMREIELFGTAAAFVSVCDSLNYITEPSELQAVFQSVNLYLERDGLFLFDFNTDTYFEREFRQFSRVEETEQLRLEWTAAYAPETRLLTHHIQISMTSGDTDEYDWFEETHIQRGYSLAEIKTLLTAGGMDFVDALDADSGDAATEQSGRIFVIAKERQQTGKLYVENENTPVT